MINFKDKIKSIIDNQKSVSLRFLSLNEQSQIKNLTKHHPIVTLDGGYPEAELKRAYFYHNTSEITCYKLTYNKKQLTLTHQNMLGTLLSLGITKDSIGDILPTQGLFFVTNEIKEELKNSFTMIQHVPIELVEYNTNDIMSETSFLPFSFTIESLRLDNIAAKIMRKSRTEAQLHIQNDYVKVNHEVINKNTKLVKENDIISIRKHGRFIIKDCHNTSKKGKIIVNYQKYV